MAGLESRHGHHHHQTTGEARGISPNWQCLVHLWPPASATSSGPSTSLPSFNVAPFQGCTVRERELELWASVLVILYLLFHSRARSDRQAVPESYRDCCVRYSTEVLACRVVLHPLRTCYMQPAEPRTREALDRDPAKSRPREPRTQNPEPGNPDPDTKGSSYLPYPGTPKASPTRKEGEQTPVATLLPVTSKVTRSSHGLSPAQAVPETTCHCTCLPCCSPPMHATMYRVRASRPSTLPTLSSVSYSLCSSSSPLATTTTAAPIFTARLPHLALGQQRYKSVQVLRPHLLPSTSSHILHHHHLSPKNTKPFLNLRNHSACAQHASSDITVTLSTHEIYTSPHTNNMGVEIPTEQWAQVCKQVGGRKFGLNPTNQPQSAFPPLPSPPLPSVPLLAPP